MTATLSNFAIFGGVLLAFYLSPIEVIAQAPASAGTTAGVVDPITEPVRREVLELIEQLASTSFAAREQATSRLLEIGQPALPQLKQITSRDFEVRYRARLVVERIEDQRFEVLSRSFLLDPASEKSYGLPAWKPFSELVGHSRTSKLLFLDTIRLHPELINMIDRLSKQDDPGLAESSELEAATAAIATRLAENRMTRMQIPEIGDFTALLFATSFMDEQVPIEVNELLGTNANLIPVTTYMRRRGYGPALRRLYDAWIPKSHATMAFGAITISLRYGLESGAEIARKNLASNLDIRTREQAIHCLARFGGPLDIARLAPLLDDETLCHEFAGNHIPLLTRERIAESNEPPPGAAKKQPAFSPMENGSIVRINDLALAAMCMLAEEDPESVFPDFERNEVYGFDSRSIAVVKQPPAQEARRRLINAWKRRFAGNPGS